MSDLSFDFIVCFKLFAQNNFSVMPLDHNIFIPSPVDKLYKPLALVVGVVVHHQPEIAVDSSHKRLRILLTLALLQLGIVEVYTTERSS